MSGKLLTTAAALVLGLLAFAVSALAQERGDRRIAAIVNRDAITHYDLEQRIFKQLAEDSIEQRVRGLAAPVLIVWGAQDRILHPASAGILQMLLTRSEVVLMPGVGHIPMLEQPEKSALDYLHFRATL